MYKLGDEGWEDLSREQTWSRAEVVRLLQEAGERVAGYEAIGTRVPQREQNHDRLVAAHNLGT